MKNYEITVKYNVVRSDELLWASATEYIADYLADQPELDGPLYVSLNGIHMELNSAGMTERLVWEEGWIPFHGSQAERVALISGARARLNEARDALHRLGVEA